MKEILQFIFLEYILCLIGVTLLPIYITIGEQPMWSDIDINLYPFHFVKEFWSLIQYDPFYIWIAVKNVLGNLVLLMPLGFLLPLVKREMTRKKALLCSLGVSAAIEILQTIERILGIGLRIADIDDLILNCAGAWIGVVLCYRVMEFLRHIKKESGR